MTILMRIVVGRKWEIDSRDIEQVARNTNVFGESYWVVSYYVLFVVVEYALLEYHMIF